MGDLYPGDCQQQLIGRLKVAVDIDVGEREQPVRHQEKVRLLASFVENRTLHDSLIECGNQRDIGEVVPVYLSLVGIIHRRFLVFADEWLLRCYGPPANHTGCGEEAVPSRKTYACPVSNLASAPEPHTNR